MWKSVVGCNYYESSDFDNLGNKFTTYPKFAFFDMDKTLITPKNARNPYTLHIDPDTYNFTYLGNKKDIISLFQSLKAQRYVIAIITNQSRYTDLLQSKIDHLREDLENELGWSPYIFIGRNNKYLKPATGTFKLLCKILGFEYSELNIDFLRKIDKGMPHFFMVGDASGKEDTFPPYRYASTDRDFAKNLSLLLDKRYTVCHYVRPIDIFGSYTITPRSCQELVITVGNPGSGKSTASYVLEKEGYKICISDVIKNRIKLAECVKENLENGDSVVVDAMNPYKAKRRDYIKIAKELDIPVRILWFIRDGRPFNALRGTYDSVLGGYRTDATFYHKEPVPEVAFNTYSKQFEEPSKDEGEIEIVY